MKRSSMSLSVVVKPQPMRWLWARTMKGAPGEVAPARCSAGVSMRARYQMSGVAKPRCGSLASSGLPETLCLPSTTQLFEAKVGPTASGSEARMRSSGRLPFLRGGAQQGIFRRQRAALGEIGVDAGGIGLEGGAQRRRERGELPLGGAVEAERAHRPVGAESRLAEQLRQSSGAEPPHHVHLEEPVPGMEKAEREGGVAIVRRADMRHAAAIAGDADLGCR